MVDRRIPHQDNLMTLAALHLLAVRNARVFATAEYKLSAALRLLFPQLQDSSHEPRITQGKSATAPAASRTNLAVAPSRPAAFILNSESTT